MLRMLGAAQKREVKATQNLSIIVLFFMICWIPLYTINCIQAFCVNCHINGTLTDFCIILSHLNSAVNPLLYAYHLRDFRAALKHLLYSMFGIKEKNALELDRNCRPSINSNNCSQYNRRPCLKTQPSSDSLFMYRNKIGRNSMDNGRKVPVCMPIVANTAVVAAASAGENPKRDMWMITEMPSASASENNGERSISVFPDGFPVVNAMMNSESSSSGNLNSGYVDDLIDDLEIGEDEVFYADASTFSANDFESDTSEILRRSEKNVEILTSKKNSRIWCLSTSSPQLSRSLFVVEGNTSTIKSANNERRLSIVDRKRPNLSISGDYSPAKSLKLSPVKAVGEFLLHNSNKCTKKADD